MSKKYDVCGRCGDDNWFVKEFDDLVLAKMYQKKCQLIVNGFHKTRKFDRTSSKDPNLIINPDVPTEYFIVESDG
jgi:hypothetical protein